MSNKFELCLLLTSPGMSTLLKKETDPPDVQCPSPNSSDEHYLWEVISDTSDTGGRPSAHDPSEPSRRGNGSLSPLGLCPADR